MIGGIATTDTYGTSSAFTASQTGLAVDLTGGSGSSADATVDTDGSGSITAVTITVPGTNYEVGDIITVNETAGPGVGTFRVATVA